jgi:2',3'-cyclic-nucleotide 2'-phosphodiesterase (5'-nucleotidase family)
MVKTSWLTKTVAFGLSVILLATNTLFAHRAETALWTERRSVLTSAPSSQPAPNPLATLSSNTPALAFPTDHRPYIVHIQDIHGNLEAQRNIAALVKKVVDDQRVTLVALEGATGPISLESLRAYPDKTATEKAADYLLRENIISGNFARSSVGVVRRRRASSETFMGAILGVFPPSVNQKSRVFLRLFLQIPSPPIL